MFLKQHCQRAVDEETFNKMVEKQIDLLRKERMKPEEPPKPAQNGQATPNGTEASADAKPAGENGEEKSDAQQNSVEPVAQTSEDSQTQQEVCFSFE